jgi:hypothetical protein
MGYFEAASEQDAASPDDVPKWAHHQTIRKPFARNIIAATRALTELVGAFESC